MMFRIGFEWEFYAKHKRMELKSFLTKELNTLALPSRPETPKKYDKFYIVKDPSLPEIDHLRAHELISPIMPLDKGTEVLHQVLELMKSANFATNKYTGLHINLSFQDPARTKAIDPVKLVIFLNHDMDIAVEWARDQNPQCKSIYQTFFNSLKQHNHSYFFHGSGHPIKSKEELEKFIPYGKKFFVNLTKWRDKNYLEWRAAGNLGYEHEYKHVMKDIAEYCRIMTLASNPEMETTEYQKRIKDILARSLSEIKYPLHRLVNDSNQSVESLTKNVQMYEEQMNRLRSRFLIKKAA